MTHYTIKYGRFLGYYMTGCGENTGDGEEQGMRGAGRRACSDDQLVPEVWVTWKISGGDFFAVAAQPQQKNPPAKALKLFRVKAAVLTLRSCVFCSGSVGGFTFAHLSVRLPRNFTSKHLAQASFGVVWLNLLRACVGEDRETWRVWSRNETDRQYTYNSDSYYNHRF